MKNSQQDIFDRLMDWKILSFLRPFYKKHKEVLLYLFFGGLTTVISIAVFQLLSPLMGPLTANVAAWVIAVAFAYVTNRTWVFSAKAKGSSAVMRECASFYGGRVATLVLEEVILLVGIRWLKLSELLVKILAQVLVIVGNYFISKLLVFREKT